MFSVERKQCGSQKVQYAWDMQDMCMWALAFHPVNFVDFPLYIDRGRGYTHILHLFGGVLLFLFLSLYIVRSATLVFVSPISKLIIISASCIYAYFLPVFCFCLTFFVCYFSAYARLPSLSTQCQHSSFHLGYQHQRRERTKNGLCYDTSEICITCARIRCFRLLVFIFLPSLARSLARYLFQYIHIFVWIFFSSAFSSRLAIPEYTWDCL